MGREIKLKQKTKKKKERKKENFSTHQPSISKKPKKQSNLESKNHHFRSTYFALQRNTPSPKSVPFW